MFPFYHAMKLSKFPFYTTLKPARIVLQMAQNASQGIWALLASEGLKQPPDPLLCCASPPYKS